MNHVYCSMNCILKLACEDNVLVPVLRVIYEPNFPGCSLIYIAIVLLIIIHVTTIKKYIYNSINNGNII